MWPRQGQAVSPPLAPAEAWLRLTPEGAARYDGGSDARRGGLISGISPLLLGGFRAAAFVCVLLFSRGLSQCRFGITRDAEAASDLDGVRLENFFLSLGKFDFCIFVFICLFILLAGFSP